MWIVTRSARFSSARLGSARLGLQCEWALKLTPLLLVRRLGISGTVPPLSHMLSWLAQGRIYLNVQYFYTNVWTFVSAKALFSLSPKFYFAHRLCQPLFYLISYIRGVFAKLLWDVGFSQIRFCPSFVSTPKFYLISYIRGVFATLLWDVGFNWQTLCSECN